MKEAGFSRRLKQLPLKRIFLFPKNPVVKRNGLVYSSVFNVDKEAVPIVHQPALETPRLPLLVFFKLKHLCITPAGNTLE
jgi:hypothetical protein